MRILIGVAVTVVLGCAPPWEEPSPGQTAQASSGEDDPNLWPACPDRPDCTKANGTGVYFEEGGRAAMDPSDLMIVRFINNGSTVDVVARYHQKDTGFWEFTKGRVEGVLTSSGLAPVRAMTASATIPTWSVAAPSSPSSFFDLTDLDVVGLKLALSFPLADNTRIYYAFWLNGRAIEWTHPSGSGIPAKMYKYPALYQPVSSTWNPIGPIKVYCVDAHTQTDPLLFQEGINVDPVFGSVTRSTPPTKVVTLSCRKGAIATVFSWGYRYLGSPADTFYFDAGIHMKRASYCADGHAYTETGANIAIEDNRGINTQTDMHIEALWTPTGATCLSTLRRPHIAADQGFSNLCGTRVLPACPTGSPSGQWLRDWVP